MADHRKSFRPCPLVPGARLLPRGRLIGAALALLGALAPALAQDAGLKSGGESLAAGKYESAVRQLSATVNDQNASVAQAAKALYLRGIAYRKLGQPARAISDLGAAVWLGLPASDKVRALVNKGLAYKAAGLSSQGDEELAQARRISSSSEVEKLIAEDGGVAVASANAETVATATNDSSSDGSIWDRIVPSFGGSSSSSSSPPPAAPAPEPSPQPTTTAAAPAPAAAPTSGWGAQVADESSASSSSEGNRVTRWFGSLTGDSAPAPAATPSVTSPAPAPPPRTTTAPKAAPPPPSAASWAANTETTKVVSDESGGSSVLGRWFSSSSDEPSAPAATQTASAGGAYQVQLANSQSQAEAQALWKQVSRSSGQLAGASPQIDKVEIGSFGTFYSLKIGPFASREESTKVCNAIKRSGTDCSVVSPDGP